MPGMVLWFASREHFVLHYWVEKRMPIVALDEERRLVKSSRRSTFGLKDDVAMNYAQYDVDNVFEHLSEPGEWYLDRRSGKLYYTPQAAYHLPGGIDRTFDARRDRKIHYSH